MRFCDFCFANLRKNIGKKQHKKKQKKKKIELAPNAPSNILPNQPIEPSIDAIEPIEPSIDAIEPIEPSIDAQGGRGGSARSGRGGGVRGGRGGGSARSGRGGGSARSTGSRARGAGTGANVARGRGRGVAGRGGRGRGRGRGRGAGTVVAANVENANKPRIREGKWICSSFKRSEKVVQKRNDLFAHVLLNIFFCAFCFLV